jgi:HEAT repeat protein
MENSERTELRMILGGLLLVAAFLGVVMLWAFVRSLLAEHGPNVGKLISQLADPNDGVREHAAMELGFVSDARAVDPLIAALNDKDYGVRVSAVDSLGYYISDPRSIGSLIAALKDPDSPVVRDAAAKVLGWTKAPRAVEPLIAALQDKDFVVRGDAATALGGTEDPRAVEPLIAALQDKESVVRWDAAKALGVTGDPRSVEPLIAAVKDPDDAVRRAAADALSNFKDPRAIGLLIAVLKHKPVPNPRLAPGDFAQAQDTDVRRSAAHALGEIGSPSVEPLVALLNDPDSNVQLYAAFALDCNKDMQGQKPRVPSLDNALASEKFTVAMVASHYDDTIERGAPSSENVLIEALYTFGNEDMAEHYLNSGNPRLEQAAVGWGSQRGLGPKTTSVPSRLSYLFSDGPKWGGGAR